MEWLDKVENPTVLKYLLTTNAKINSYDKIVVYISGGADSDVMLDMFAKLDKDKKVNYVFYNTGIEYNATKEHLKYLEKKYNIQIQVENALKSIPTCCKQYGQPFLSKWVSEMISRLQKHNFKWEDKPYEQLVQEYPKCKSALKWWTNSNGENSSFNIKRNKLLKEFLIENNPNFKISNKCCTYAKKECRY